MSFNISTRINNLYQLLYPINGIVDIQDISGIDISNNYNYSNTNALLGATGTFNSFTLGTITKPTEYTTTHQTNFYLRITGKGNPIVDGYMTGGAWIRDVESNIIAKLEVGNNRDFFGSFDISSNTMVNLSPSQFPLTVQEYVYFPSWYILGSPPFTCNVVMSRTISTFTPAFYSPILNKFGYSSTQPSNVNIDGTVNINGDLNVDTNTLFVDASNNRVGIGKTNPSYPLDVNGSVKFTTLVDAENSVGTNGQVLISNGSALVWNDNRVDVSNNESSAVIHYPTFCQYNTTSQRLKNDKTGLAYQPSTNYFGIGTITPAYNLDVSGTGRITGDLIVDSNTLFVDASNNRVGVGTTTPAESLDVSGWIRVGTNTGLKFRTSGASGTPNISVSGDNILSFNNTANITTMALTNNNLVGIGTTAPAEILHIAKAGGAGANGGRIRLQNTGTRQYSIGTFDTAFNIYDETGAVNRMYINYLGNVGIGTTTPDVALDISSNNNDTQLRLTSNFRSGLLFFNGSKRWQLEAGGANVGSNNIGIVEAGIGTRLTCISGGNVGIGTTTPAEKLSINGGNLLMNGTFDGVLMNPGSGGGSLAITRGGTFTNNVQQINAPYTDNIGSFAGGGAQISLLKEEMTFSTYPSTSTLGNSITLTERMRLTATGLGIATTSPTNLLDVNGNSIRLRTARTPASASATGTTGEICWDSSYIYVCIATNTWKRVAISTW